MKLLVSPATIGGITILPSSRLCDIHVLVTCSPRQTYQLIDLGSETSESKLVSSAVKYVASYAGMYLESPGDEPFIDIFPEADASTLLTNPILASDEKIIIRITKTQEKLLFLICLSATLIFLRII